MKFIYIFIGIVEKLRIKIKYLVLHIISNREKVLWGTRYSKNKICRGVNFCRNFDTGVILTPPVNNVTKKIKPQKMPQNCQK